ncbi:MAG: GNAT family N-acetyltransferase [Candidatus Viridilinea halotolerans]|uniref:GNAT family N-acetyltransferase n=1 Tax=Candidatus Viridilinea halotolerans TaxID=2491704 RepID=A0A426TZH3_9CHLR|nr:MAG: GNAT family N-acetyltransferase [Candidatus Viridilinea halotolerans]
MRLFRKSVDLSRATPRILTPADLPVVSRLLRDAPRRYYGLSSGDLVPLLEAQQGIGLELGQEICALAMLGWPIAATCWLRALALAEGVEVQAGVAALLAALRPVLAARDMQSLFYAGDEGSDGWLVPLLKQAGFGVETDVLVYEKRRLDWPTLGPERVQIRPAALVDLAEVLRLDQCCFEPQWVKDSLIMRDALAQGPYFMLAEQDGALLGYAYATTHFQGRLVHLVRIAVAPEQRGLGIGVRLLADLVGYAKQLPAHVLTLNTQAYNARAQRLYHWFGFRPTGEAQQVLRLGVRG